MRLKSGLCWHLKLRLLFREKIMRATMWNHHLGRAGNMVNFTCLWPVVKMHRHYSKQICPIPGMTSFPFFFYMYDTLSTKMAVTSFPLLITWLHQSSAGMYSLPLESGLSLQPWPVKCGRRDLGQFWAWS